MLSSHEMDEMLSSLGTIAAVEAAKAYKIPGTVAGDVLRPYASTTIRMEPSGVFVVSRPDGEFRAANAQQAIPMLVEGWIKALDVLRGTNRFDEALKYINGPARKAAEAYATSHR